MFRELPRANWLEVAHFGVTRENGEPVNGRARDEVRVVLENNGANLAVWIRHYDRTFIQKW